MQSMKYEKKYTYKKYPQCTCEIFILEDQLSNWIEDPFNALECKPNTINLITVTGIVIEFESNIFLKNIIFYLFFYF